MSETNPPLSVSEVLEMNVGDWVNEGVVAIVRKIEPSGPNAKRKFWRCDLGDTVNRSADISMTLFFAPKFGEGDVIEITGKGIKRDEFNSYARISVGKSTEIHVRERAGSRQSSSRPPANDQHPPPDGDGGGDAPPAGGKSAPYVNGQTIGMALKEAIPLVRADFPALKVNNPELWKKVYETSSDILRISHHLAAGHLAPAAKDRAQGGAGAAQKPPTERTPPRQPENLDEDVPF